MSIGFSAYSRTLSTLVFIEIFSGTERVAPVSLNIDQKRLELVWIFGYSVVTSTLVTFRVQTRHSMIKWHQEQFLFIVTSFTRLWDSPTNYDDSIFSLSCAKSTKLSFLKALLQRFLRFFDPMYTFRFDWCSKILQRWFRGLVADSCNACSHPKQTIIARES